ncbi:MAG: hypothetical protein AAF281_00940 [Pseudomonadota bacterium]
MRNVDAKAGPVRRGAVRGFTVLELFVVIVVILIVLAISVPAFSAMLRTSEETLAENALSASVIVAREIAAAGEGDAAAVFQYDPEAGYRISIAREAALMRSTPFEGATGPGVFDVLTPADDAPPVTLPRGYSIRGYAAPGTMQPDQYGRALWYDSADYAVDNGSGGLSVAGATVSAAGHWLFPEDGFYDRSEQQTANENITARQSFMVRFKNGTAEWTDGTGLGLFVDPAASITPRRGEIPSALRSTLDVSERVSGRDLRLWARYIATTTDLNDDEDVDDADRDLREALLGPTSNDSVVVKSLSRFAVYRERDLALGIGARGVNRQTASLYAPFDADDEIALDTAGVLDPVDGDVRQRISQWITGDTNLDGVYDTLDPNFDPDTPGGDRPRAAMYVIQRQTGDAVRVSR